MPYKRIMLKISGEALAGSKQTGIDHSILKGIAADIKAVHENGVSTVLVLGAGNFFRGSMADELGIDRAAGDYMGMLGTVMNALAMKSALESLGITACVMTAFDLEVVAEPYTIRGAKERLAQGQIVIAAAGTGHPYFTTDTAAALRAVELGCDVMLKATKVDGVYTEDPQKKTTAKKIDSISYIDVIGRQLKVMDLTSVSLCMENNLPMIVFDLFEKQALVKIAAGEEIGTLIS